MIRDEDLKSSVDYSEGQKRAAHRVLVELVNIFQEYEEEIRVVGGWVPDLMFPGEGHVGSVDVDIMLNHLTLHDEGYQNMSRILMKNGYTEHPEKYFSFVKTVVVDGISYDVDVDILAGMYRIQNPINVVSFNDKEMLDSKYMHSESSEDPLIYSNIHYNGAKTWKSWCPNLDQWWECYRKSPIFDPEFYFQFFYDKLDYLDQLSLLKRLKILARYFLVGRKKCYYE